jgi:unsaturated rhamnogalacturonyl hydrolase
MFPGKLRAMTTPSAPWHLALSLLALLVFIGFGFVDSVQAAEKPVLLYSRYFNARGESRYLPDGTYKDVLEKLGRTFQVRSSDEPLNAQTLKGVSLVLIANPSDKAVAKNPPPHHCSAEDVAALTAFVKAGGGVVVMGNQENHNLEIKDFNNLLESFGMKWVSKYTDAKQLVIPKSTPVIGGLRWAYYTGNQVVIDTSNPAHARSLVDNDLNQKPVGGPRDEPGSLLAVADAGKGHFVAVTDAGWISNDALSGKGIGNVSIKEQDNFEICLRLFKWAAGQGG